MPLNDMSCHDMSYVIPPPLRMPPNYTVASTGIVQLEKQYWNYPKMNSVSESDSLTFGGAKLKFLFC